MKFVGWRGKDEEVEMRMVLSDMEM